MPAALDAPMMPPPLPRASAPHLGPTPRAPFPPAPSALDVARSPHAFAPPPVESPSFAPPPAFAYAPPMPQQAFAPPPAPAVIPQTFAPPPQPFAPPPAPQPFAPPPAPAQLPSGGVPFTVSPFELEPARDDTALFRDRRVGFSHLLPGRPTLGTPRPGEPAADCVVHLQDAPITVRYKLEPAWQRAQSAGEAAAVAARHIATLRARGEVTIDHANDSWLATWGAEGAAVCNYDLEHGTREDLFVLARGGQVLVVTWTYPAGLVEDPAYAAFASIAEATMVWDAARWDQRGRVWPESTFLGPGLYGTPRATHNEACRQLASLPIQDDERVHLLTVLSGIVSTAGAPWMELGGELRDAHRRALLAGARHPTLRAFIEAAFAEVTTCHDLRGMAVMLGRAIERRRSSAPPAPPVPARHVIAQRA